MLLVQHSEQTIVHAMSKLSNKSLLEETSQIYHFPLRQTRIQTVQINDSRHVRADRAKVLDILVIYDRQFPIQALIIIIKADMPMKSPPSISFLQASTPQLKQT